MTKTIPACLVALAVAAVPMTAMAQESATTAAGETGVRSTNMDAQIAKIGNLTEIKEMTVVRLHAAPQAAGEAETGSDAAVMSDEDLLLSGVGERKILTGEDEDEETEAAAAPEPAGEVETEGQQAEAETAAPSEPSAGSPLQTAIEQNEVLSGALQERDVALDTVVAVEIREGTNVIVYTDES